MKRIGLIGGMSWESTAEYYRLLNEGVRTRLGGLHSADLVLRSVDFAELESEFTRDRWDVVGERLAAEAQLLQAAGAELIALCTNTGHRVAPAITAAIDVEFVDLIDVSADALRVAGVTSVALLGTRYTMAPGFYRDRLAAAGFDVTVPDNVDEVNDVIFAELCVGVCSPRGREAVEQAVASCIEQGADGALLACTELELLEPLDVSVPTFATTRLHVEALLDRALS